MGSELRWGAVALAVMLFQPSLRRAGERNGEWRSTSETMERADAVHRRMLEAVARRPHGRDELAQRLRDGRFWAPAARASQLTLLATAFYARRAGKKFPKTGNLFPSENDRDSVWENFPAVIARALQSELGLSHRAAKTLIRWTGASERTVKQWLSGAHGPRGEHLVALLRESDAVFESPMVAADRRTAALTARVLAAQTSLENFLAQFEKKTGAASAEAQGSPPDSAAVRHAAEPAPALVPPRSRIGAWTSERRTLGDTGAFPKRRPGAISRH